MAPAPPIRLHPEVAAALDVGGAVVALESAVLTHGLPRPLNLEVAQANEAVIREAGAVPATIAILDGCLQIGLSDSQLERLAEDPAARKCSRRDLPIVLARGGMGGTTVSATTWAALRAGVRVFATGGIGGVHRGSPFDVSADLVELGRSPIVVVCSGAKSLLDLPATLEVLETQGVPVLGFGSPWFPAFYARDTRLPVAARVESEAELARIARARDRLGLSGAILLTVPVPAEHAMPTAEVERIVVQATEDVVLAGTTGADITPQVLARMAELSGGRTLAANRALLANNARVAARVALALVEDDEAGG